MTDYHAPRDLELLDTVDAFAREPFSAPVWRVVREGRDPTLGAASNSRWCNGTFEVLYTSLKRDGAIAEIHSLLSLQPVFPSKLRFFAHRLNVQAAKALRIPNRKALARLGIDVGRYRERQYTQTRDVADAAYFLGFDTIVAPSARWDCFNAVVFTDRMAADVIEVAKSEPDPIDWDAWKRSSLR